MEATLNDTNLTMSRKDSDGWINTTKADRLHEYRSSNILKSAINGPKVCSFVFSFFQQYRFFSSSGSTFASHPDALR